MLAILLFAGSATLAEEGAAGWLGVFIGGDRPDAAEAGGGPPAGVRVRGVVADGPAASAGLRARDRILEVDGLPVAGPSALIERVGSLEPGSWIPLTVERGGAERTIRVRLDRRPEQRSGLRMRRGWVGLDAIDLPPSLRTHFGADDEAGVMVFHVEPYGPAWTAGVAVGDLIVEVGGARIASRGSLQREVAGGGVGNELELIIMRNGARIELVALIEDADDRRVSDLQRVERE